MTETLVSEAQKAAPPPVITQSVREFAPGVYAGWVGDGVGIMTPRTWEIISAWGSYTCDVALRSMFYSQYGWLVQGATNLFLQNFLSTPFEISGGRNLTYQWQDIFFEAEFGEGYDYLLQKVLQDLLTLNRGAFIEKVSYGDPDKPLSDGARILGLNHLDAMRISYTGNYEYPYLYWSEHTSKMHRLHRTRVIRLVDMPSPNTRFAGYGMAAMYRALSVTQRVMLVSRYQHEMLSDAPPPGFVVFENVKPDQVATAIKLFEAERQRDGQQLYRGPLRMEGLDPSKPVKVEFVTLAAAPADFDFEKYTQQDVNATALAYGMDPQDLWPLTSAALGSGAQSKVLQKKTSSKGYGYWLTRFERVFNTVTPRPLEFKYKAQNAEAGRESAEIAQMWVGVTQSTTAMTEMERRQLLANQVPEFADVLLDAAGNVRLPDDDPKQPGQEQVAAGDAEQITTEAPPPDEAVTVDDAEQAKIAATRAKYGHLRTGLLHATFDDVGPFPVVVKDYAATKSAYTDEVAAVLTDAVGGAIGRGSFGARLRGVLQRYGKLAYLDGLSDGGVVTDTLDPEETAEVGSILAGQQQYVNKITQEIYDQGGLKGTPAYRAGLWTKSLEEFHMAGLISADKNGLYEWNLGNTEEHCTDCLRLSRQKHRLKHWKSKGWLPRASVLACNGYNCDCELVKTDGRAIGNF